MGESFLNKNVLENSTAGDGAKTGREMQRTISAGRDPISQPWTWDCEFCSADPAWAAPAPANSAGERGYGWAGAVGLLSTV